MQDKLLQLICMKNNISYILFDTSFHVLESYNSSIEKGSDIREYLYELVGMEEQILQEEKFSIPMIVKEQNYYDLSIEPFVRDENSQEKTFIAYLQEKSKDTIEYANVLKEINKKTLIYDTSDAKKEGKSFAEINRHLITLHVDLNGIITLANDAATHFFNLEKSAIKGKHFSHFFTPQKSQTNRSKIFIAKNASDKEIFFHADIIPLTNSHGTVIENIIIAQDVTYLKEVKKELEYAQEHDTLTGLPNRHHLLKAIDQRLVQQLDASIALIDIQGFSSINEEYGSHAADMLLKHITQLLTTLLDRDDLLTRLQSDNFVILFEANKNRDYITRILEKIEEHLEKNPLFYTQEDIIHPRIYHVLLQAPKDAQKAHELLELAQKTMQKKKIAQKHH